MKADNGLAYLSINLTQDAAYSTTRYIRYTILDFYGKFSAQALGIAAITAFIVKTHQSFDMNTSMLKDLYWKVDPRYFSNAGQNKNAEDKE